MKTRICYIIVYYLLLGAQIATAQNMQRVKQTIDTLCSPYMDGRGYRHQGAQKAAAYLAEQFRAMKLQAFDQAPDYLQNFHIAVNHIEKVSLSINGKKLRLAYDYLPHPASASGKGKKKILWIDSSYLAQPNKYELLLRKRLLKRYAILTDENTHFALQTDSLLYTRLPSTAVWLIWQSRLIGSLSQKPSLAPTFLLHEALLPTIRAKKRIRFRIQQTYEAQHPCYNVIGYVKGSQKPEQFIVITAHYDHLGSLGNVYFPGANDNASGVSMLLELAQHISQNPLACSVAFIAFGAEEMGLRGSWHYVQRPVFPLQQISFLINLDMVGTGEEGITVVNGKVYEEAYELLQAIDLKQQYVADIQARGTAANSDHYFFSAMGIPAFFIYARGGSQAYHHPDDQPEALSLAGFEGLFQLLVDFMHNICPRSTP